MFARITTIHVIPDRVDEAIELYRRSVIPEAKKQRGFKAAFFMVDRKLGKGNAMTFWRNEKDALANEENLYYQEQLVKFIALFQPNLPPIREGYEVQLCAMAGLGKEPRKK